MIADDLREAVVDQARERDRHRWLFHMRSRCSQAEELRDAELLHDGGAIGDVAMAAHGDVVVAGIVQSRVAVVVDGDLHVARAGAKRVEVGSGIEVIVEVNDHLAHQ